MREMAFLLGSAWWPPLLQTAIGGLIGALGAVAGGAFGSWFTWQRERQSVAAALAGEVQGVIDFLEWRQVCEDLSQGRKFYVGDLRFVVFEANVGKIGLLPADLAGKVVAFYNYAGGILQDFKVIGRPRVSEVLEESEIRFIERLVKKIEAMLSRGDALFPELRKEAERSWADYLQPG